MSVLSQLARKDHRGSGGVPVFSVTAIGGNFREPRSLQIGDQLANLTRHPGSILILTLGKSRRGQPSENVARLTGAQTGSQFRDTSAAAAGTCRGSYGIAGGRPGGRWPAVAEQDCPSAAPPQPKVGARSCLPCRSLGEGWSRPPKGRSKTAPLRDSPASQHRRTMQETEGFKS